MPFIMQNKQIRKDCALQAVMNQASADPKKTAFGVKTDSPASVVTHFGEAFIKMKK